MEKELEYLKMYLDWLGEGYVEKNFTVNFKNQSDNYFLLKNMASPIINTYDTISIQEEDVIISHMATRADNLEVTNKNSCRYHPTRIEMKSPEIFSLESFKNSDYYGAMLDQISDSYENVLEKGKELYEKYQKSLQPLTVLIQVLDKGASIRKIKNGYIIDDMYYESLEEFLNINENS